MQHFEHDPANGRYFCRYSLPQCGLEAAANVVPEAGGRVPLHAHAYAHLALVMAGDWEMTIDGGAAQVVRAGHKVEIPVGAQHTFVLLKGPGEIFCTWPTTKG